MAITILSVHNISREIYKPLIVRIPMAMKSAWQYQKCEYLHLKTRDIYNSIIIAMS